MNTPPSLIKRYGEYAKYCGKTLTSQRQAYQVIDHLRGKTPPLSAYFNYVEWGLGLDYTV